MRYPTEHEELTQLAEVVEAIDAACVMAPLGEPRVTTTIKVLVQRLARVEAMCILARQEDS